MSKRVPLPRGKKSRVAAKHRQNWRTRQIRTMIVEILAGVFASAVRTEDLGLPDHSPRSFLPCSSFPDQPSISRSPPDLHSAPIHPPLSSSPSSASRSPSPSSLILTIRILSDTPEPSIPEKERSPSSISSSSSVELQRSFSIVFFLEILLVGSPIPP